MTRVLSTSLAGFTVLLTASRRTAEWTAGFTRHGAHVLTVPVLSIEPLPAVDQLLERTRALIDHPPDDVVVTTAIGLRSWVEAADAHGLAPALLQMLASVRIWARGPKVRGALHGIELDTSIVGQPSETSDEICESLLAAGISGRRIAVQLHGSEQLGPLEGLVDGGASVEQLPVYRWGPPVDPVAVERSMALVGGRGVDVVVFVSAPGAEAFLGAARAAGRYDEVVHALAGDVTPAAVGPVTAAPLRAAGLDPLVPDRFRLGALVRVVTADLIANQVRVFDLPGGGELELRGRLALVDGEATLLTPGPLSLLRRLCRAPGEVVSREALLGELPGGGDAHAVDVAMARLRASLGRPGLIETVIKRGYRLAAPP